MFSINLFNANIDFQNDKLGQTKIHENNFKT